MNHQARLSERIVQDVVDRLASGRELPFRLNVLGMARHYGISRTPVREAIEELQRLGKLTKLSNGRFVSIHNPEHITLSVPRVIPAKTLGDIQTALCQIGDSHLQNSSGPLKDGIIHFCPQIDSKTVGDNLDCPQFDHQFDQFDTLDHPSESVPHTVPHTVPHAGSDAGSDAGWSQLDWRDGVRQGLVEEVVRLSLRGQTTFLREQVWSERLGIGRGLLRQMLSELAGQGFVEHVPRRGWQVRPFDANAMLQYLEIREVLELHALDLAKDNLEPQRLQAMLAGNPTNVGVSVPGRTETECVPKVPAPNVPTRTGSVPTRSAPMSVPETLNNEIHGYLIQQSRNRYIADFFARHSTYYSQLFEMAAVQTGWRDAMAQQHREILEALLDQDISRAKHALAHHIRAQRPVVQELLRQVLERPQ